MRAADFSAPVSVLTKAAASEPARTGFELGLDICAFLFLPVLVLASRGAAPLAAVAGVLALGLVVPRAREAWLQVRPLAGWFGLLGAWGLLSALWAVEPHRSLVIALRLGGMFAAGLALVAAAREIEAPWRLAWCLAAGLLVALVLTAAQFKTNGMLTAPLSRRGFDEPALNHVEDGFGLLLVPLCVTLFVRGQRVVAIALAIATTAIVSFLVGDIARIAFLVAIAAAVLLYFWRVPLARVAALASVVLVLIAPQLFPPLARIEPVRHAAQAVKFSAWHRLEIWSFVGARIAEKPLCGWGLDSSRAIPGGSDLTPEGRPWLPLHPHNAALQFWLELGVPGAVWFALFVAWVWQALAASAWPRLFAAAAGGSFVAALVVALGSYGAWQEWWVSSEFLTLFLILVMARLADARTVVERSVPNIPRHARRSARSLRREYRERRRTSRTG